MKSETDLADNGDIVIRLGSINDLLALIPAAKRDDALQSLACDDAVIRHVMDQVLTGSTQSGYYGASRVGWLPTDGYPTALEMAREKVVALAEPATREYVERMRRILARAFERNREDVVEARKREDALRANVSHWHERAERAEQSAAWWEKFANAQTALLKAQQAPT